MWLGVDFCDRFVVIGAHLGFHISSGRQVLFLPSQHLVFGPARLLNPLQRGLTDERLEGRLLPSAVLSSETLMSISFF